MPRTARPGDPPERNLVASVSVLTQTAYSCTILQAHPRNILLHASYASRSSHERLSPGPIGWISTILDMNFREFSISELRRTPSKRTSENASSRTLDE